MAMKLNFVAVLGIVMSICPFQHPDNGQKLVEGRMLLAEDNLSAGMSVVAWLSAKS